MTTEVVRSHIESGTFEGAQEDLRSRRNFHTYNGGFFENIVAEAIRTSGGDLYYYRRESRQRKYRA